MDWRVGMTTFKACLPFWLSTYRLAGGGGYCYIGHTMASPYRVEPDPSEGQDPTSKSTATFRVWVPSEWKQRLDVIAEERAMTFSALVRMVFFEYLFPEKRRTE